MLQLFCSQTVNFIIAQSIRVVCNRRHHTLLHVYTQPTSASNKRVTSTPNPSANQQGSAPAEVNTYCSLKIRPINHVLLATAIVEVKNKYNQYVPCRVLLVLHN